MSSLDWPRASRACDGGLGEIEDLAARMRGAHERAWAQHESVKTLLRRHFPGDWNRVRGCRMSLQFRYKTRVHEEEPNVVMLQPECRDRPFCPACNDVASWNRASGLLRKLKRGTPKGRKVTAFGVTLAVSALDGDDRIVRLVSGDIKRMKEAAYRTCGRLYGEGVGVLLAYQHYGQEPLVRLRPHVHCLVNGHKLNAKNEPEKTPTFDLQSGGKEALNETWFAELKRAFPEGPTGEARETWFMERDTNIQHYRDNASVAHAAKYIARELIDFRDFEYGPRKRIVYVTPYKQQGPAVTSVPTLQHNLSLYNARFQPWSGRNGRRVFDAACGELSDKRMGDTALAMGSDPSHRDGCWCHECSQWSRLMVGRIEGEPGAIDEESDDGWR